MTRRFLTNSMPMWKHLCDSGLYRMAPASGTVFLNIRGNDLHHVVNGTTMRPTEIVKEVCFQVPT